MRLPVLILIASLELSLVAGVVRAIKPRDVEVALSRPAQVAFDDTPIDTALDSLSQRYKIPIVLDLRAMREAHIHWDSIRTSTSVSDTLANVLVSILEPH